MKLLENSLAEHILKDQEQSVFPLTTQISLPGSGHRRPASEPPVCHLPSSTRLSHLSPHPEAASISLAQDSSSKWNFRELLMAAWLMWPQRVPADVCSSISICRVVISWAPTGPHSKSLLHCREEH